MEVWYEGANDIDKNDGGIFFLLCSSTVAYFHAHISSD
jgi:hypothetical protein